MLAAVLLLLGLTWSQGTLKTLIRSPQRLAYRGEDWRGAVKWLKEQRSDEDAVWLDPGLIESEILVEGQPTNQQRQYLGYPVSGPYQLSDVRLIPQIGNEKLDIETIFGRDIPDEKVSFWVIARASPETANRFIERMNSKLMPSRFSEPELKCFAGVCVIRFEMDGS